MLTMSQQVNQSNNQGFGFDSMKFEVPGLLKRVCSVCKCVIGYKKSGDKDSTGVTHGYCKACINDLNKELGLKDA